MNILWTTGWVLGAVGVTQGAWLQADGGPTGPSGLETAQVIVAVSGADRDEGAFRIALFDDPEGFTDEPVLAVVIPPTNGEAEWLLSLPYGTYALAVVHDADGNGKLNTNLLGMPRETYGFSNDARGTFGPPSFADASFNVGEPVVRVAVRVR